MPEKNRGKDQSDALTKFWDDFERRNTGEPEFLQAVHELIETLPDGEFLSNQLPLLRILVEPERSISFRVTWEDDKGNVNVNRGWRVQFNNALGPYKGGIRFHPNVNESVLKFLAFEQTFKNALTGLPLGGAKGGSDFNPKGRSQGELRRFCQSFMTELHKHIGENRDIPAGDIGVGSEAIGYLFGQYKRISDQFVGTLTGKDPLFGGSVLRAEATGYGVVYFLEEVLSQRDESIEGKRIALSGAGNVALHAAEKFLQHGAHVLTLSDSQGYVSSENGVDAEQLKDIKKGKADGRALEDIATELDLTYKAGERLWSVNCDIAVPCATQNELDEKDAQSLVEHGCGYVVCGANMPCTPKAIHVFEDAKVVFVPSKAANAGGVAVSAFERTQNAILYDWDTDKVDNRLLDVMKSIHVCCG